MRETVRYSLAHRKEALAYAMSFARGMDPAIADRFVGMWVNDMTVDCGERGRRAVQELLDRGHDAGDHPEPRAASTSWRPEATFRGRRPTRSPRISLPDLDGVQRPLAMSRGARARALIVVGHRDCATTRLTLPFVDRIHQRRARRARPWSSCCRTTPAAARALVADLGLDACPCCSRPIPIRSPRELELRAVPTLMLVGADGPRSQRAAEGFSRDDLEAFSRAAGGRRRRSSRPTTPAPAAAARLNGPRRPR